MKDSPPVPSSPIREIGRRCGDCTLCCSAIAVYELGKGTGTPCRHVAGNGCSIHCSRPAECRDFDCLWLQGWFDVAERPDALGVVFFVDCGVVCVTESSPGSSQNPRVQQVVRGFLEAGTSIVIRNSTSVTKISPDGTTERAEVDQSDPFRVSVLAETIEVSRQPS